MKSGCVFTCSIISSILLFTCIFCRPQYQLRLFCTSSIFYAGTGSFRTSTLACPIEFPATCEVRVNNTQITANLKGLKKKPGTAPPPDLNKYARIGGTNKVEMVYVNSQQPVQSKVSDIPLSLGIPQVY